MAHVRAGTIVEEPPEDEGVAPVPPPKATASPAPRVRSWDEIAADPRYRDRPPEEQERLKASYFQRFILPTVPASKRIESWKAWHRHVTPPPPPSRGVLGDIGASLASAFTVDIPETGGRVLRELDPPGGIDVARNIGTSLVEGARKVAETRQFAQPSKEMEQSLFRRGLAGGFRAAPLSLAAGAPGAILGLAGGVPGVIGGFAGSGGVILGLAERNRARDEALQAGLSPEEADRFANKAGLLEGGLEAASNVLTGVTLGVGQIARQPLKSTVREMIRPTVKGAVKRTALALPFEVGTEVAQEAGGAQLRQDVGMPTVSPATAAKEAVGPAVVMTLLFGAGAHGLNLSESRRIGRTLSSATARPDDRAAAAQRIAGSIAQHDPEMAQTWLTGAAADIEAGRPIALDADLSAMPPRPPTPSGVGASFEAAGLGPAAVGIVQAAGDLSSTPALIRLRYQLLKAEQGASDEVKADLMNARAVLDATLRTERETAPIRDALGRARDLLGEAEINEAFFTRRGSLPAATETTSPVIGPLVVPGVPRGTAAGPVEVPPGLLTGKAPPVRYEPAVAPPRTGKLQQAKAITLPAPAATPTGAVVPSRGVPTGKAPPDLVEPAKPLPPPGKTRSLMDLVRQAGGIRSDIEGQRGEADFFQLKEGVGLVNNQTGKPWDRLRERAVEEGFVPEDMTLAEFQQAVRDDAVDRKQGGSGVYLDPRTVQDEAQRRFEEAEAATLPDEVPVGDLQLDVGDAFTINRKPYVVDGRNQDGDLVIKGPGNETLIVDDTFGRIPEPDAGSLTREARKAAPPPTRAERAPEMEREPAPSPPAVPQEQVAEPKAPYGGEQRTLEALIARYKPGNPFAKKAAFARLQYDRLVRPTARERAMEQSFPLGGGFGRSGGEKRIEATIDRAVKAEAFRKKATYFESQADAFDAGTVNAQGRSMSPEAVERSDKRYLANKARQQRIEDARAERGEKPAWQVPVSVYADASGQLGGSGRKLVESNHREAVEAALAAGETIPPAVLKDYPDLAPASDQAPGEGGQREAEPSGPREGGPTTTAEPSVPYQPADPAPIFFSQLRKVVEAKMPNAAPASVVKAMLASPKHGVKAEEMKWSGLDDFLAEKKAGKVTKQEVLDFLAANEVQVREVERRESADDLTSVERGTLAGLRALVNSGRRRMTEEESAELERLQARENREGTNETKFSSYTLPGGQNYRELLLTLPDTGSKIHTVKPRRNGPSPNDTVYDILDPSGQRIDTLTNRRDATERAKHLSGGLVASSTAFRSAHFDEPNVLAHVRMNDRVDADGKRVLFIEEVQSDWHQKGKREGYRAPVDAAAANDRIDAINRELSRIALELDKKSLTPEGDPLRNEYSALMEERSAVAKTLNQAGVPDAPFKKTWHELALKRMLRYAAEQGYDKVAWTTGEQQAERYDLSKQVKHVAWEKNDDGTYNLNAPLLNGDPGIYKEDLTIQEVEGLVGKDIARRIADGEGTASEESTYRDWRILEGENLKVGGEGMKGFYDQILPAFLKKYSKQLERKGLALQANTPQEKSAILYEGGASLREIGQHLGVDHKTVSEWLDKRGVVRRQYRRGSTLKAEAVALYKAGKSQYEIAEQIGASQSSVGNWLTEFGEQARKKTYDDSVKAQLKHLYQEERLSVEDAASMLGMPTATAMKYLRQAGATRSRSEAVANRILTKPDSMKGSWGKSAPYYSDKTKQWEFADSRLELARMVQLDDDADVKSWTKKTERVPYGDGKNYVPDFKVEYHDGRVVYEEVKPSHLISDRDVKAKAEAAKVYFGSRSQEYRFITEDDIGTDRYGSIDATMEALAEKWGATVGTTTIPTDNAPPDVVARYADQPDHPFTKKQAVTVPAIDITPAMKRSVLEEGQSLFEPKKAYTGADEPPTDFKQAAQAAVDRLGAPRQLSTAGGALARVAGGVRTLGVAIQRALIKTGRVDLRGHIVKTAEDLAALSQVFRNPSFETFRVFYIKDGEIVAHEGITSRLPATTAAFTEVGGRSLIRMQARMTRLGADSYYIEHNHPSGDPDPSTDDMALTRRFAKAVPGFKGHIVIDHGRYAVIDAEGSSVIKELKGVAGTPDPLLTAEIPHDLLGRPIRHDQDIVALGRALTDRQDGMVTILYRGNDGAVRAIEDMPLTLFLRPKDALNHLRGRARSYGTAEAFAYFGHAPETRIPLKTIGQYEKAGRSLVRIGGLRDAIADYGPSRGAAAMMAAEPDAKPPRDYFMGRKMRNPGLRVSEEGAPYDPAALAKITGDSGRAYSPAQRDAFARVGRAVEIPSLKERVKHLWADAGKKLAQGLVDQFAPVKELSMDAYTLLRLSKGASGAFNVFLHGGTLKLTDHVYDVDDTRRGGAIKRLLIPLQAETDDFLWWVAANRAEQLATEDREHLFSEDDITAMKALDHGATDFDYTLQHGAQAGQVTRDRPLIYRDALTTFNEFNTNALDMAEQSGLIDGESRQYWEKEFYVPFYRVDEDAGLRGMNIKSGVVRQQAFKQLKGGRQKLHTDLLENTLMNWAHLLDAAAKNRAAKATLEAAERVGAAHRAEPGEKKTVWHMGETIDEEGTRRFGKVEYTVDDPYILTAITSLEYAGMKGPVMDAMSQFKHWLTIGVTASPFFKIRNLIRDSVHAIGTSPLSYNLAGNVGKGVALTRPNSDAYFRLLAGGGTIHFGTMLEGSESRRVRALVKAGVDQGTILDNEGTLKAFYTRMIEPAITAYNELGNRGETINRASLYAQLRQQGKSHADASLLARDLLDFSMGGAWTSIRFLTQTVPFMNARLQGLYKLGRASKDDPRKLAVVLGATATASIALMLAYEDDDDWKKREDWDRDNYWWFKMGGTAFRIPKPFEIGALATLAERGVELFASDEMTGDRFRKRLYHLLSDNLSLNPVPQLVKPVLDIYANKDSFTGRPIETMGMERLRPAYRMRAGTSMVARGIGTAGNVATGDRFLSPVQVDHLVRGYFGWLGSFVVGTADRMARPATGQVSRPAPDYWKLVTGGMVADKASASSRYVTQMYEQAREIEQAYGTWRMLLRSGKAEEAREFRNANLDDLKKYRLVTRIKRHESNLNERIRFIERSDKAPDEKRRLILNIQRQKDLVARRVSAPHQSP